jgi:hypothetical protein
VKRSVLGSGVREAGSSPATSPAAKEPRESLLAVFESQTQPSGVWVVEPDAISPWQLS